MPKQKRKAPRARQWVSRTITLSPDLLERAQTWMAQERERTHEPLSWSAAIRRIMRDFFARLDVTASAKAVHAGTEEPGGEDANAVG